MRVIQENQAQISLMCDILLGASVNLSKVCAVRTKIILVHAPSTSLNDRSFPSLTLALYL